jgi:hypothetical protein
VNQTPFDHEGGWGESGWQLELASCVSSSSIVASLVSTVTAEGLSTISMAPSMVSFAGGVAAAGAAIASAAIAAQIAQRKALIHSSLSSFCSNEPKWLGCDSVMRQTLAATPNRRLTRGMNWE